MADVIGGGGVRVGAKWLGGEQRARAEAAGGEGLPLVLRSASWGRLAPGRFGRSWSKRYVMCKWVVRGEGAMRVGGRRMRMGPGDVGVYVPTIEHAFWAVGEESEMCWFTVDGALCESYAQFLGLRPGVYGYGEPPVERVREMIEVLGERTFDARLRGSELAIGLLHEVARRVPRPEVTDVVQQVRHLVRDGLGDPELSAKGIAKKLGYNRSALSELFRRHTGTTIMECITAVRLQEAEALLRDEWRRVGDVARMCGFRDASYFTRWVKKHTGRRPGEVREGE